MKGGGANADWAKPRQESHAQRRAVWPREGVPRPRAERARMCRSARPPRLHGNRPRHRAAQR